MPSDNLLGKSRVMRKRELERLMDLLGDLSEQDWLDGSQRDDIGRLRSAIDERLEGTD